MEFVNQFIQSPVILFLLIIVSAWILEDAAVIAGALIAVDGYLNICGASIAVILGITSGDLALYFLGYGANRWRKLRAWVLMKPRIRFFRHRFKAKTFSNILIIRFVPGLRTVGFTLCGLWRIPFWRFFFAMLLASFIWVLLIFYLVYQLGSTYLADSNWKWLIMTAALGLLVVNNAISYYKFKKRS